MTVDDQVKKQLDDLRGQLSAVEMLLARAMPRIQTDDGPLTQETIDDFLEPLQSRTDASEAFKAGFKFATERVLLDRPRAQLRALSISIDLSEDSEP